MERAVIDPTANVRELVLAESKFQNEMRLAEARFQNAMREAETRRIDGLASLRVQYETIIENMRSAQTLTNSTLLATQLKEVKVDLSDRTSKMEQFRWETGGKGTGLSAAFGYVLAAIMAGIAALNYFK